MMQLQNATRKMGTCPPSQKPTMPTVPPGFDPLSVGINNSGDTLAYVGATNLELHTLMLGGLRFVWKS